MTASPEPLLFLGNAKRESGVSPFGMEQNMLSPILRSSRVVSKAGPLLLEHCGQHKAAPADVLAILECRERADLILVRRILPGVDDKYDLDACVVVAVSPAHTCSRATIST